MSKKGNKTAVVPSPETLPPTDKKDKRTIRIVIETPKGSRNKYAYNQEDRVFELKKVLPAGMAFPYDFGFVPSTLADDGDPVDVLVLMDEPAFPGCVLKARLIGAIEGEQVGKDGKQRNDRIVAVEQENHSFADISGIRDLGKHFVRELQEFFVNYHALSDEKYKVLGVKETDRATKLIEQGQKALRKSS